MPARYDAVLFDLDGTLLDSIALILESYRHTLVAHGLAPRSDDVILAGLGTTLEAQLGQWAPASEVPAMVATYVEHNLRIHDSLVRPYPGVTEIVHALRARGTKLAIVTSKRRRGAAKGLAALGLAESFDAWVCADDVARPKPDPEPVRAALSALSIADPVNALFVGDAIHDVRSGRAAGVRTAAVLWGAGTRAELTPAAPDHLLEDAAALEALLFG